MAMTGQDAKVDRRVARARGDAVRYLEAFGCEVLSLDWECPDGRVDVVARDCGEVVFIDVMVGMDAAEGFPVPAVDAAERARREKVAAWYLCDCERVEAPVRFDVVATVPSGKGRSVLRHYRDVLA